MVPIANQGNTLKGITLSQHQRLLIGVLTATDKIKHFEKLNSSDL